MSPRTRKEKLFQATQEAIKETAWRHIARHGAAALSLRAIAREMDVTAPALYRYFPDRDALVTALIVDAFTSLGESQKIAIQDLPTDDLAARLSTLGLAYREWAVTYSQRYQLIFGTPIPGYEAPSDITVPAASASLIPLLETVQAISTAGRLRVNSFSEMHPMLKAQLASWGQFVGVKDVEVLYTTLVIWSRVHGLVSIEIGNQFPSFITEPAEVFRREITSLLINIFKE